MAIILPKQGSFGGTLGTALGTGIGSALENLANLKTQQVLQKYQQQQQAQGLAALFEPQQAQALSTLPLELLKPIISEKVRGDRQLEQTGPGLKTIIPQLSEDQASKIGKLSKGVQNLWYKAYQDNPNEALKQLNGLPQVFTNKEVLPFAKNVKKIEQVESPREQNQPLEFKKPEQLEPKEIKRKTINQVMLEQNVGRKEAQEIIKSEEKERVAQKKEKLELDKIQQKEQHHIDKETLPTYEEINKSYKSNQNTKKILSRMQKLVEEGNLGMPVANSVFRAFTKGIHGIGIDLTSLMTADAQEFEKLSNQLANGISSIFPGRILQSEFETYLRQFPNLGQSKAGMQRVINGMNSTTQAIDLRKKAMDEIIEENAGKRPKNMEILIEKKIGPKLDKLAEDFKDSFRFMNTLSSGILTY